MKTFREYAKDQIQRMAGTVNFPSGPQADKPLRELVDTLERCSKGERTFIERLVTNCLESSKFCPTVADLLMVSTELREEDRRKAEAARNRVREWEQEYGKPEPFVMDMRPNGGQQRHAEMWDKLRKHFRYAESRKWPDWATMAEAARELGYDDFAKAWEKGLAK